MLWDAKGVALFVVSKAINIDSTAINALKLVKWIAMHKNLSYSISAAGITTVITIDICIQGRDK